MFSLNLCLPAGNSFFELICRDSYLSSLQGVPRCSLYGQSPFHSSHQTHKKCPSFSDEYSTQPSSQQEDQSYQSVVSKFFWRIIYLVFQSARIPELLNCRDSFLFPVEREIRIQTNCLPSSKENRWRLNWTKFSASRQDLEILK